jgi:hypothetical protein
MEIPLTPVQLGQRIPDAVIVGELHLVGGGEGVSIVVVISSATGVWRPRTPLISLFVFDPEESRAQHLLLLAVIGEGGLERSDLILQRNKRTHHVLN